MIIILKKQAEEAKINALKKEMEEQGLGIHESEGVNTRILGLVGDTSVVDMRHIMVKQQSLKMYSVFRSHTRRPTENSIQMIPLLM